MIDRQNLGSRDGRPRIRPAGVVAPPKSRLARRTAADPAGRASSLLRSAPRVFEDAPVRCVQRLVGRRPVGRADGGAASPRDRGLDASPIPTSADRLVGRLANRCFDMIAAMGIAP